MLDIPIGKAITPILPDNKIGCAGCCLLGKGCCSEGILCDAESREDGKNVVFKLVDLESVFKKVKEELDNGRISNARAALDNLLQGVENER